MSRRSYFSGTIMWGKDEHLFSKGKNINLLRILWHHSSKSLVLHCSLCFSVLSEFYTRLFSFHIPMLMRSCLSKLVSQAQHLYLTVSKVVTVVSTVRKIFHLSFLSVKARCKKALLEVFSWHRCCGCRVKGNVLSLCHWAVHVLPSEQRAGSETSKTCQWKTAGVRKIRELPSACDVFMWAVEAGVDMSVWGRWKGNLLLPRGPVAQEFSWDSFTSWSFKTHNGDVWYWASSHLMQNNLCVKIYRRCEEPQHQLFTAVSLFLLLQVNC